MFLKMSCIDFNSTNERNILDYIKSSSNNIVIFLERENMFRCATREHLYGNNLRTIFNSNKTYYRVFDNIYVCPMDLRTLQNTNYSFFKFEHLRFNIYNVKKYSIEDYMKIEF